MIDLEKAREAATDYRLDTYDVHGILREACDEIADLRSRVLAGESVIRAARSSNEGFAAVLAAYDRALARAKGGKHVPG